MPATPMIAYAHVAKTFDGGNGAERVVAVDDVSLEVAESEFLAIVGGSGSGKTTLLRLANRLIQLATSAGEVRNSGITIDITNEALSSLSDIGYFTTSRILSKWEHDGMLSKHRGGVTLLAPESLMAA